MLLSECERIIWYTFAHLRDIRDSNINLSPELYVFSEQFWSKTRTHIFFFQTLWESPFTSVIHKASIPLVERLTNKEVLTEATDKTHLFNQAYHTKMGNSKSGRSDNTSSDVAELVRQEISQNKVFCTPLPLRNHLVCSEVCTWHLIYRLNFTQVVIFSKSTCPYCSATKGLFQQLQNNNEDGKPLQVKIIELDRTNEGSKIQDELYRLTQQRTVPNVFVNNQHVGGNDNTQAAYRNGQLFRLLGWSDWK